MTQHIKIIDDLVPPDLCAAVIQRFDADARVEPDPQPDYSTRHYLHISKCMDWAMLNVRLCQYVNQAVAAYFARPPELAHGAYHEWSDDGYVVARYEPGDICVLHIDGQTATVPHNTLRLATLIIYLNDVEVGGETHFPWQGVKVAPKRGRAVLFPVGFTHPHEVLAGKSRRYILQSWITDPNFLVQAGSTIGGERV